MAVALATLPLNSEAACGGAGLWTGAALGGAAGVAAGLPWDGLATATGFAATFFVAGLATGLADCFAAGLAAGLATTFFATGLAAAFFAAGFFATGLRAAAGLAAGFFATGFFAAGFFTAALATFFATGFFAGALVAAFDARAPAAFALAEAASRDRVVAFPFDALAAVELRVVFAMFLHHFWLWRPGVIAHVSCTDKPGSGILATLPATGASSNVNVLTRFLLFLLRLYKRWLSPLIGQHCRFYPSCSDYARGAITRFGPWRGSLLTAWRLLRCQPLCDGGEDPVPERFHFARCRHGDRQEQPP